MAHKGTAAGAVMTALDGPTRAAGGSNAAASASTASSRAGGGLTSNASVKPGSVVAGGRSRAIADTSHGGQPGRSAPRWAPTAATDGGSTCTTVQKRAVRRVGGPGPEASAGGGASGGRLSLLPSASSPLSSPTPPLSPSPPASSVTPTRTTHAAPPAQTRPPAPP
ncbi:hypothetical protein BU14_0299s0003 [Porphyra umbilicalis]|uniref:Uncharacterized protein n=1 Tax=Porphyra umbilicalis TaxID=2786 RepID=A0A1X6P0C7_PORUM|nr:hypothetical protein BU14_0299s0003 [Porphyra umbilicalis]|eukprot:OSX74235.1 hypothetical protein BU14_0299s0003 [Porphyra umbilicalis]